jgi:hypothetical protein
MKGSSAGIVAIVMLCLALSAPGTQAQSEQSLNLTPLKTSIRTRSDDVHLTTTPVQIFADTEVTCPKTSTKGCTLEIEVAGQFAIYGDSSAAQITVKVSPNLPSADPEATVNGGGGMVTFDWMQREVSAGATVTVNIQANVNGSDGGDVYSRTETVTLFKN